MSEITDAVMAQVTTVLDRGGMEYNLFDDGSVQVGWAGPADDQSIRVKLWCEEWEPTMDGNTYTVPILLLQAPLVVDFELTLEKLSFALLAANQFNQASLMKMRVQTPPVGTTIEETATGESKGWIYMEAEIVATDLDPSEIILLLFALKDTADEIDDLVAGSLGGKTLAQFYRDGSTTGGLTLDI